MIIDAHLPINSGTYPFKIKKSSEGTWRMSILEKGFAKFSANYARLNGGKMSWARDAMTNKPQLSIKQGDMSDDASLDCQVLLE